jgi:hypothetical protein
VAHGVQALVVIGIQQVVFVHFGDARLDDPSGNRFQHLVDAQPSRFTIVSYYNKERNRNIYNIIAIMKTVRSTL